MSKRKPKAIVLDCDDVIVDFMGYLCILHNKKYRTHITRNEIMDFPLKVGEVENLDGEVVKGATLMKTFKHLEPHGLYVILPAFEESKPAIDFFKDLGYQVIIITARHAKFKEQTELSMLRHDIHYDRLIFSKSKADEINKLKEEFDVVLFADDRAETVQSVNEKCDLKFNILVNRPHNLQKTIDPKVTRVNDLMELIQYLK